MQNVTGLATDILPFILCGGGGSRLWPLSREAFPKQFHSLTGTQSLFQQTCRRLSGGIFGRLSIISNDQHRFFIHEQLQEIGIKAADIVLEPIGENTAPAACIASLLVNPDAIVLLAPSDLAIGNDVSFAESMRLGAAAAREGFLVTFGVEPDWDHTGYGYIETDGLESGLNGAITVNRFIEKPSHVTAEGDVKSETFFWNAGIVLARASTILDLFQAHAPELLVICRQALIETTTNGDFLELGQTYDRAPSISLEAILEKASNLACVPLSTSLAHVGSWSQLWNCLQKDSQGNVARGEGNILFENANGNYAYAEQASVALVGVENIIVVAMGDAVLIVSKESAEAVKSLVEKLNGSGDPIARHHSRVYWPWGWHQVLQRGDRYLVKRLMVKPGGTMSLQYHNHHSQHLVVVRGTVAVTRGNNSSLLTENQSAYISIGEPHRLANPGSVPAFLIEVQSGAYLDEDDIVRIEDVHTGPSLSALNP